MSELPKGWTPAGLLEVSDLLRGVTYTKSDSADRPFSHSIPILRAGNITARAFDLTDLVHVPERLVSQSQRVRKGDVVVATSSGSIEVVGKGAQARQDLEVGFGAFCGLLRPNRQIEARYFGHFFATAGYRASVSDMAQGVNINNLKRDHFRSLVLPLPPFKEQKRIADKLDALLARVDACRQRLGRVPAILKRFRQSVLAAATSGELTREWREERGLSVEAWQRVRVREIVTIKNGRAFPSADYGAEGVRLVRPGNLHVSGRVEWSSENTRRLPARYGEEFPDYLLGQGELLMNLTAQSLKDEFLGRVCLKNDQEPALLNQRICAFYPTVGWDVRPYLFLYFRSPTFRRYVDTLDSGTLIKHMHSKQLLEHELQVPTREEAEEICRRASGLLAVGEQVDCRLAAAQAQTARFPSALLAKAFRGELVPQDPNDEPASVLLERLRAESEKAAEAAAEVAKPSKRKGRPAARQRRAS